MNDSLPSIHSQDSSNKTIKVLRTILPGVVKKFTPGRPDYSGTKEYKNYFDAWFEIPGAPDQYALVGFSKDNGEMYWCIPKAAKHKLRSYLNAGYYEDGKYLYKDFELPSEYIHLTPSEQESWLIGFIGDQIQEYDRLTQVGF